MIGESFIDHLLGTLFDQMVSSAACGAAVRSVGQADRPGRRRCRGGRSLADGGARRRPVLGRWRIPLDCEGTQPVVARDLRWTVRRAFALSWRRGPEGELKRRPWTLMLGASTRVRHPYASDARAGEGRSDGLERLGRRPEPKERARLCDLRGCEHTNDRRHIGGKYAQNKRI